MSAVHPGRNAFWPLVLVAAAIMVITMGARQTLGLFVSPLNTSTGLGIATVSFAMAIGQFVWGAAQPIFGVIADRWGTARVILLGGLMLAAGLAATPFVSSAWALTLVLGVLTAAGAGAGSLSILLGAVAQQLPAEKRSTAAGIINAGGSLGQFIYAPIAQAIITSAGWVAAMLTMAASALLTLPFATKFRRSSAPIATPQTSTRTVAPGSGLREQLRIAFADRSYLCLHAGFFTCGFHIAFLVTHLPGEVNLCGLSAQVGATTIAVIGLANIAGSLSAGWLGNVYRMKWLLYWMYFTRAVAIAVYLVAPKTPLTFYMFAAVLGFTWLSTVPPTAGLVGKLFGTRHLATLFGLTLLTHQVGAFFGAWLGGLSIQQSGNYQWMWYADIALSLAAALINLPIREAKIAPALTR